MSSHPRVSIITSVYIRDQFLPEAIEGVLAQEFTDFEMIITDDASSDHTRDLVANYPDPRCRYRRNVDRLGNFGNHCAAIAEAHGEYIAILNDDDIWERDFLYRMVKSLDTHPEAVLAFCDHKIIDQHSLVLEEETTINSQRWQRDRLSEGIYQPFHKLVVNQSITFAMGTLWRKSALDLASLPKEIGSAYDLWIPYILSVSGQAAYYQPAQLTRYRIHPQNLTSQGALELSLGTAFCWQQMAQDERLGELRDAAKLKTAISYYAVAKWHLRKGNLAEAKKFANQSLSYQSNWRAYSIIVLALLPATIRAKVLQ